MAFLSARDHTAQLVYRHTPHLKNTGLTIEFVTISLLERDWECAVLREIKEATPCNATIIMGDFPHSTWSDGITGPRSEKQFTSVIASWAGSSKARQGRIPSSTLQLAQEGRVDELCYSDQNATTQGRTVTQTWHIDTTNKMGM